MSSERCLFKVYAAGLPVREVSRCPICGKVLGIPIDDLGLDGPWWWTVCPTEFPPPRGCVHFQVYLGALDLHGRAPVEVVSGVKPGPGATFVIDRLLSMEGMQAVLSTVRVGRGDTGYLIAYHWQGIALECAGWKRAVDLGAWLDCGGHRSAAGRRRRTRCRP